MARWLLPILLLALPLAADEPPHPSTEDYRKALALQKKKRWKAAQRAFRRFLKKWPESPHVPDAEVRSGENAYLGCERIWTSGPAERRIDVSVMGDGFTIAPGDQKLEERWAKLCIDVLWNEKSYSEYRNYFNIYFVRLASFEEGVDPGLTPEELKKAQERNKRRRRDINHKLDYSTALDCKAAGPQGQVMADRGLVYQWLEIAEADVPGCGHDRLVIAFARFGKLGMGGGGIANVGRPDKSITVHEFGHAFSRLLDEYAVNPALPQGMWARSIRAANASTDPDPKKVPWAHMIAKRVKGVGVYEGGATFRKGVWRPARTCAMNTGGNQFCPVCREQNILVIYEHVSPIDRLEPVPGDDEVVAVEGDDTLLTVFPMEPERHRLVADWYVEPRTQAVKQVTKREGEGDDRKPEEGAEEPPLEDDNPWGGIPGDQAEGIMRFGGGGARAQVNRDEYAEPLPGEKSKLGKSHKRRGKNPPRLEFPLGKLPAGLYTIHVEVSDTTRWVIKDEKHLLRERAAWKVRVRPK